MVTFQSFYPCSFPLKVEPQTDGDGELRSEKLPCKEWLFRTTQKPVQFLSLLDET